MRAKKYLWSILCVYFCYLTHGIQAIILSQNNVNFAKQWGFNMTDPQSAAYAAGLAILSSLYLVAQHKKIFGKSAL